MTENPREDKLADGFYVLEIKNGETASCQMLTEGEAGVIASYRVQIFLSSQSKDKS